MLCLVIMLLGWEVVVIDNRLYLFRGLDAGMEVLGVSEGRC